LRHMLTVKEAEDVKKQIVSGAEITTGIIESLVAMEITPDAVMMESKEHLDSDVNAVHRLIDKYIQKVESDATWKPTFC
jgi:hypothetical protein